jgi:hypothetical protein
MEESDLTLYSGNITPAGSPISYQLAQGVGLPHRSSFTEYVLTQYLQNGIFLPCNLNSVISGRILHVTLWRSVLLEKLILAQLLKKLMEHTCS